MHCFISSLFVTSSLLAWGFLLAAANYQRFGVEATPPVQAPLPTCRTPQQQQPPPSLFGVSQRLPSMLSIRGGAVEEPESLADVKALLLKAGSEQKLVVIDFTATWCGPCKMIAPLFKEMSEAFDDVVFVKVDVDENPDTAAEYNVSAMPTFVFIKGGVVIERLMGANPSRLQELIREYK
ncbi:hypothetical protein ACA910_003755 [Epithemia clementina (nom. ined.)]